MVLLFSNAILLHFEQTGWSATTGHTHRSATVDIVVVSSKINLREQWQAAAATVVVRAGEEWARASGTEDDDDVGLCLSQNVFVALNDDVEVSSMAADTVGWLQYMQVVVAVAFVCAWLHLEQTVTFWPAAMTDEEVEVVFCVDDDDDDDEEACDKK